MFDVKESTSTLNPAIDPKYKKVGIIVVALAVPFIIIDVVFLRGETVFRESSIRFSSGEPQEIKVPVQRVNEKHTLCFDTRKRELALSWQLLDPEGNEVASDDEYLLHDGSRRHSFTPTKAGEYTLVVDLNRAKNLLGASSRDRLHFQVRVGDRQVLGPIFEWFNF